MSRQIDEKVVSLQFDNAQFEKNVKTSMDTLEKFEKQCKFEGAEEGFKNIEKAAERTDLNPLFKATVTVSEGFSALERVAINVLSSIAIRAEQAGERMVKSLTIDNVTDGYGKYEEQISSVQTLVNATGKSIEEINGYLDTLMRFSDETSYSFTDMASSLGQLASSGGDVEKLMPMIMGIANATAFAGKQAAEFKRAIYNLNQSYGAGALKYMDWKSLELAGVASKQLKQAFIDTAIEAGTLSKNAEDAKGNIVSIANFGETLKNNWATTEVMEKTFGKFYQYTQKADEMVAQGIVNTYTEAYKMMVEQNPAIANDVYYKAARAAQEATTFQQAIVATKDAVSSGWMTTFSNIFGDYDMAKKTWSNLAEDLYTIFAEPGNRRNEIFGEAFKSGLDSTKTLLRSFGLDMDNYSSDFEKFLRDNGYNVDELINQYGSLSNALANEGLVIHNGFGKTKINDVFTQFSNKFLTTLDKSTKSAIEGATALEKVQSVYDSIWKGDFGNGLEREKKLAEEGIDYATAQYELINKLAAAGHKAGYKLTTEDIQHLNTEQLKNLGITEELTEEQLKIFDASQKLREAGIEPLSNAMKELTDEELDNLGISKDQIETLRKLHDLMNRKSGQVLLQETLSNLTGTIINLQDTVGEAWSEVFDWDLADILYRIVEGVNRLSEKMRNLTENSSFLKTIFKGFFSVLKIVASGFRLLKEVAGQLLQGVFKALSPLLGDLDIQFEDLGDTISGAIDKVTEWLQDNEWLVEKVQGIAEIVVGIIGTIGEYIQKFADMTGLSTQISEIGKSFEELSKGNYSFEDVKNSFMDFFAGLTNISIKDVLTLDNLTNNLQKFIDTLIQFGSRGNEEVMKVFGDLGNKFKLTDEQVTTLMDTLTSFSETLIGFGAGFMVLKSFDKVATGIQNLTKPLTSFSDAMLGIRNAGNGVAYYFHALKNNIKINNIIKIAVAIAILAGALYLLAKCDQDALIHASVALVLIAGAIWILADSVKKSESAIGNGEDFKNVAMFILAIGGAMLLVALAMKKLDDIKHVEKSAGIAAGILLALLGVIFVLKIINKNLGSSDISVGSIWTLIGVAAAIYLIALAISKLDSLKLKDPKKTLDLLLLSVLAIAAITWAARGVKGTAIFPLIGAAGAILLVAFAIEKIANITDDIYMDGLKKMIPIVGILIAICLAMRGASASFAGIGLMAIGLVGSVYLLGLAIKQLSSLTKSQIEKAKGVVQELFVTLGLIIGGILFISHFGGGSMRQLVGAGLMAILLSASLYLLVGVIYILKNIPEEDLKKAKDAIQGMIAVLGISIALMGLTAGNFSFTTIGAFSELVIMIAILAAAMFALSFVDENKLNQITMLLVGVFGSLTLLFTAMAGNAYIAGAKKTLANLAVVIGLIAAVGAIIWFLDKTIPDVDRAKTLMTSFGELMKNLAEAMIVMAAASAIFTVFKVAGTTFAGLAGFVTVVSVIATVVGGLAAMLFQYPGEIMDQIIAWVGKFGELIGTFFGSIVGSLLGSGLEKYTELAANAADNLVKIGDALGKLSKVTFKDTLKTNIGEIKDMIKELGDVGFINALKRLSPDNIDFETVGAFFEGYSAIIKKFSSSIGFINNTNAMNAAISAGHMFTELINALPTDGGYLNWLKDKFLGEKQSISSYVEDMGTFGDGIKTFAEKMAEVDISEEDVTKVKELTNMFTELEGSLNREGGLWQKIIGSQDIGDFGTRITSFAYSIMNFARVMSNVPDDQLESGKKKAKGFVEVFDELEKGITESTSLKTLIFGGDQNIGDFGMRVQQFAQNMKIAIEALAGIAESDEGVDISEAGVHLVDAIDPLSSASKVVDQIIEIAQKFNEFEQTIGDDATGWFGQSSKLTLFGQGISNLAGYLQSFASKLNETQFPEYIKRKLFFDTMQDLITLANTEGLENATNLLPAFANAVDAFGYGLQGLMSSLMSMTAENTTDGLSLLDTMRQLIGSDAIRENVFNPEEATQIGVDYIMAIRDVFHKSPAQQALLDAVIKLGDKIVELMDRYDDMKEKGIYLIQGLIDGMEEHKGAAIELAQSIADEIVTIFADAWVIRSPSRVMYGLGEFLMLGLINAISDQTDSAIEVAEESAFSIYDAVQNAISASNEILEDQMTPVITPVLDTSNVRQGTQAIGNMLNAQQAYHAVLGIQQSRAALAAYQNGAVNPSGDITVNVNFSVNQAGGELSEYDIARYGRQIADEVNVRLGKMFGRK